MTRRGHHEGSLQTLPSGNIRWRIAVTYPDGTQRRRTGTARNVTEARREMQKVREEASAGQAPVSRSVTVEELVREHMEAEKSGWAQRTTMNNQALYRRHIQGELGPLKAAGVTPARLRAYYDGLKGLGESGQHQISALLSGAYKRGIERGLLRSNPTRDARPKRGKERAKAKAYTREEAERFLAACMRESWGWPLAFLAYTGMRIGEVLALQWSDIVIEKDGAVRVNVSRTRFEFGGKGYENTTKTASSVRSIYLQPEAVAILDLRRKQGRMEAERLKEPASPYVFTSVRRAQRGTASPLRQLEMRQDTLRHVMARLCRAAGVPVYSPHKLRHTCASLLAEQGEDLAVISAQLGHAQVSTTANIYRSVYTSELKRLRLQFPAANGDPAEKLEES